MLHRKPPRLESITYNLSDGYQITAPPEFAFFGAFNEIFEQSEYEPSKYFELKPGFNIIDIGANVGVFSIWASMKTKRKCKIHSFEPSLKTFNVLKKNIQMNKLNNVKVHNFAVTGKNKKKVRLYHGEQPGLNSLVFDTKMLSGKKRHFEQVKCISLDAVFKKFNISHCDFLKMDCEGAEYEILQDTSPETMAKIKRVVMEYHGSDKNKSASWLKHYFKKHGFEVDHASTSKYSGIFVAYSKDTKNG